MAIQSSPYIYDRPVSDPRAFISRNGAVDEIAVRSHDGVSYAILAGTRLGKTSLLLQVKKRLENRFGGQKGRVVGPVFLSTHQFGKLTRPGLFATILEDTALITNGEFEDLLEGTATKLRSGEIPADRSFETFTRCLNKLMRKDPSIQLLIMIDEIDMLKELSWSKTFFSNLRYLVSDSPISERISVMISGTLSAWELWNTAGSPFHNVVTKLRLGLIANQDIDQLIDLGFPDGIPDQMRQRLYDDVGGHPFITQFFLDRLWQLSKGTIKGDSPHMLHQVEQDFRSRQEGIFHWWWQACSEYAREVYFVMSQRDGTIRRGEINRICEYNIDAADQAIRELVVNGLVREIEINVYAPGSAVFKRWAWERMDSGEPRISFEEDNDLQRRFAPDALENKAFISYCRQDRHLVVRLEEALAKRGIEVWWDKELMPGVEFRLQIVDQIKRSRYFLICCTRESAARVRSGTHFELKHAANRFAEIKPGTPYIIPVLLDRSVIPEYSLNEKTNLSDIEGVDMEEDWNRGLDRLVRIIRRKVDPLVKT